jgi:hypothetical protein
VIYVVRTYNPIFKEHTFLWIGLTHQGNWCFILAIKVIQYDYFYNKQQHEFPITILSQNEPFMNPFCWQSLSQFGEQPSMQQYCPGDPIKHSLRKSISKLVTNPEQIKYKYDHYFVQEIITLLLNI